MSEKTSNSLKKIEILVLIFLMIFSGTLLTFSSGKFVVNFKELGFSVVSSFQNLIGSTKNAVVNVFLSVKELAELRKEYAILTEKLKEYEFIQRSNADLLKENEELKELLGFSKTIVQKNFPAQIISRDSTSLNGGLVVNKGSRHGIKKNMPVVSIQNGNTGLVGKVVSVGYVSSMIVPLYDLNCHVSGKIQNTKDIGLVSGNGQGEDFLTLQYIKKRVIEELQFGDIVITSGENHNYPQNIPIGYISKIESKDYESSLSIHLKPIIDFSRLDTVFILEMDGGQLYD